MAHLKPQSLKKFSDVWQLSTQGARLRQWLTPKQVRDYAKRELWCIYIRLSDAEANLRVVYAMSAHSMIGSLPTLFRSYESAINRAPDCTIVQAVRATTARPGIFKPVEIDDHGIKLSYVDGGLGCNNPTARMLDEVKLIFPHRHAQSIISLGTGQIHPASVPNPGLIQRVLPTQATEAMERIATDCERTSQEIDKRFQHVPGVYFRFNVDQGLQDIQHSDFGELPEVAAHTMNHHQKADVNLMLDRATTVAIEGKEMVATEQLGMCYQLPDIHVVGHALLKVEQSSEPHRRGDPKSVLNPQSFLQDDGT